MDAVSYRTENGTLTIYLKGHVDSSNAGAVDAKIVEIRTGNEAMPVVVDLLELQYISSAGLRALLKLKKSAKDMKIINASSEVYEVFDMTGFTEMMDIEKAYRTVSVEGCEVIGQGANGKVYRINPDTIIKVYMDPDSLPDIQRERDLARKAFVMGIPTAIPYDIVKVGDGYGSVFELLSAKSFAKVLKAEPERLEEIAGLYVDLLKKIHSTVIKDGDMPNIKDTAIGWTDEIKGIIAPEVHEKLVKMLKDIPDSNNMLHGDYHVKNVMLQNGEVLLIDMDTLCHGNPVFEFAFIFNAYIGFCEVVEGGAEPFLGIPDTIAKSLWKRTLELYFGTTDPAELAKYEAKASVIGYARILRRVIRKDTKNIEHYVKQLTDAVNSVDNLIL